MNGMLLSHQEKGVSGVMDSVPQPVRTVTSCGCTQAPHSLYPLCDLLNILLSLSELKTLTLQS